MLHLYAVALVGTNFTDGHWIEFYWAEDAEHAEEQAKDAHPAANVICKPAAIPYPVTRD